jgi:outer membrane protein assembly factor BamB
VKKLLLLAPALVLIAATFSVADGPAERLANWHQWRGPDASGTSPNGDPPLTWDAKTNIKWKTPLPGRGASTPIIWGEQIFLLTAIDTGKDADPKDIPKVDPKFQTKTRPPTTYHQFVVLCLDRKTGQVRWQKTATEQVPHEGHHETHTYAASSPTTDGKFLYVNFGSRGVYCFDLEGKQIWKRDFGLMHTRLGWGEGASPAVHGDSLVVPWDQEVGSFILCLDTKTGVTKWKMDRGDEPTSWATPLIVERNGKTQAVVNGYKKVRSYDLANGKVLWECGGQTLNAIPSPVLFKDNAIAMTGYKGAAVYSVPLDASGDVSGTDKIAWKYDKGTPYVPSPVMTGDRLYFTQMNVNLLTCLDVKTGKPVIDRERLPGITSLYASPVAAKDRIYFTGRDGTVVVIKRADKLEVLATNRLGEGIDASPAIVGKQLFLRGEKNLYCIEGN